jgi:adhesin transport system outer membrane protein
MSLRWLRYGALATVAAIGLGVGHASAQSLEDEVAYLLRNHPQLKGLRNQVEASEEGINRAFAAYLPTVEVTGDYGYESTDSPARRAAVADAEPLRTARTKGTLTVTQNIFDGWRGSSEYNASQLTKRGSEITLDNTTQNVVFEGIAAYVDVLRNRRLVELAGQNEETIKVQLNLENERVQRGSGIALDVLQSKARLQIARERRVAFEGELANAITRYVQVFGHAPNVESMATPEVAPSLMPLSVDDAVAIAVVEHPEAENSANLIDLAQQRRRTAKSDYFPRVDLVGKINYEDNVDGVESVRRDHSVVVRGTWELFSGFSTRASVAEAAYQYAASVDNRNFVNQKIVEDVNLSWENLQTAQRRLQLLSNAVNIAIEVHQARATLRDTGKETVLNVLDAQNEVFNAQINEAAADYDARLAAYRLLLSMGRLDAEHLVPALAGIDVDPAALAAEVESNAAAEESVAAAAAEPETLAVAEPEDALSDPAEDVAALDAVTEPAAEVAIAEPVEEPAAETLAAVEPAAGVAEPVLDTSAETAASAETTTFISGFGTVVVPAAEPTPAITFVTTPEPVDPNLARSWSFD